MKGGESFPEFGYPYSHNKIFDKYSTSSIFSLVLLNSSYMRLLSAYFRSLSTRRRRDCDWTNETMQSRRETQGKKAICG